MAYQDPNLPDPGLGRNPPRYRDSSTFGVESILVLAILAAVFVSIVWYSSGDSSNTTASNPPPVTTGQGGASVEPPANRTVPAPASSPNTPPSIDRNVPAEKIGPPIPTEPRTNN